MPLGGCSPLCTAAVAGQVKVVKRLIELGANLEVDGYCGVGTAVHWAVLGNQPKMLTALLDAGARMTKRNGSGWTPLRAAKMFNATECAALLARGDGVVGGGGGACAGGGETDDPVGCGVGPHCTWMDMLIKG